MFKTLRGFVSGILVVGWIGATTCSGDEITLPDVPGREKIERELEGLKAECDRLLQAGDASAALDKYDQLVEVAALRLPNHFDTRIEFERSAANLAYNQGDKDRCLRRWQRIEAKIRARNGNRDVVLLESLRRQFECLSILSRDHEMLPVLQRAEELAAAENDIPEYERIRVLTDRATWHTTFHEYVEARNLFRTAYHRMAALMQKETDPNLKKFYQSDVGMISAMLAGEQMVLGEHTDARASIDEAMLNLTAVHGYVHLRVAGVCHQAAMIAWCAGDYHLAYLWLGLESRSFRSLVKTERDPGMRTLRIGQCALADTAAGAFVARRGLFRDGIDVLEGSLAGLDRFMKRPHWTPDYSGGQEALAVAYAGVGNWNRWRSSADELRKQSFQYRNNVAAFLTERQQLGFQYSDGGDADQLHELLSSAWQGRCLEQHTVDACEWLLNAKASVEENLTLRARLVREAHATQLQGEMDRWLKVREELSSLYLAGGNSAFSTQRVRLLESELETLEAKLGTVLGAVIGRGWLTLPAFRRALPRGSTYVDFIRLRIRPSPQVHSHEWIWPRYFAFVIDADGDKPPQFVDLGDAAAIEARIRVVRQQMFTARKDIMKVGERESEEKFRGAVGPLSEAILRPLFPHGTPTGERRLILCPDGELWLVPWAALLTNDGRYLVEQPGLTLSYVASGRDLMARAATQKVGPPLLVTSPEYGEASVAPDDGLESRGAAVLGAPLTWESLKKHQFEAVHLKTDKIEEALLKWSGQTAQVLRDSTATEDELRQHVSPRLLVLHTHGFVLVDADDATPDQTLTISRQNPLHRCGLALAHANDALRGVAGDRQRLDGILTGMEVASLDLRGTELVVLSACETGVGRIRQGEGVVGLRQAFRLAGARTVAATLWQVPAKDTEQILMSLLNQLTEVAHPAEALREAQLKQINLHRKKYDGSHPYFWAAWTITGP